MTTEAIELFYSYSHKDESLREELNNHLSLLRKQHVISDWHDRNITAGSFWAKEIDAHLKSARVILLLVSADFLASDYCYGVEMQEAMRRQEAGEATVIPIILRPCDWESAPFGKLQALPKNGKPVTIWTNRDTAFTDIVKGIRKVIKELNDPEEITQPPKKKRTTTGSRMAEGKQEYMSTTTTTTVSTPALKKAIDRYYKTLDELKDQADYELGLRRAFEALLADTARLVKWTLVSEKTLDGGIRPDGVLRDTHFTRGLWEAKGPKSDLEKEIQKKIVTGYPLTNIIFENTRTAVLYQNKKRIPVDFHLDRPNEVSDLLKLFLTHTEPEIENFESAVKEFKERIPELARAVLDIIEKEYKQNRKFITAFDAFADVCRTSLDPRISTAMINEMLVQHLLTERLFRTIFDNTDFTSRNVIAAEIEKVIQALASRSFNRNEFLKSLDRFYVAIEASAKGIESWSERQHFLNTVYERFFQGFAVKQADVHGIVYTPQEIVDFMCASVEEVLQREFNTSIAEPGVKILDPATGTGNFIVNLIRNYIPPHKLKEKYQNDLFCNEITLLPYYIASLNIEHEYYTKMGQYEPFEGICFADTLELAEGQQLSLFVEENTERVQREKDAQIMVVIGNPPYNVGQKNQNDNNKNRKYPIIDGRIRDTYAKDSKASNKNALSDMYVKFFRWATDRLQGRDGIVCFVSNNSFLEGYAFDGFRKRLAEEFTYIYHIDLGGNARKQGGGNVFNIMVGVGITVLVRISKDQQALQEPATISFYKVVDGQRNVAKLQFLAQKASFQEINWLELKPDNKYTWINEGLKPDFDTFLSIGKKEAKSERLINTQTIFKNYGRGVATCRDDWVYDFNQSELVQKVNRFLETYNGEVDRWRRRGNNNIDVDDFVTYDDTKIKWSRDLKLDLQRNHYAEFSEEKVRKSLYRPFCKKYLFFDRVLNEEVYQFPLFFPNPSGELENIIITVGGYGRKHFAILVSNYIPDLNFYSDPAQCFPYYTYSPDGSNRRENITDWALAQFREKYGLEVSKWDIFHYVYGMLHHPQYRERYAENLKRDLPHIPLLHRKEAFELCVRVGKQLMDIHLNYEQAKEYNLEWLTQKDMPYTCEVEKMKLSTDRRVVVVNDSLRLGPLPPEVFEYRLGNRSALEWVIDQYQVSTDKRSGIVSDPNNPDDPYYIPRLVCKVVTVSVETVKLVNELAQAINVEDWLDAVNTP